MIKSNSEIFSEIYANGGWYKPPNPEEKFGSGRGSHDEKIIVPYISTLITLLTTNNIRNIVDLGCGDFWIMRHVLGALSEANYNFFYTGVDVVENLIEYNAARFKHPNIKFLYMDAAAEDTVLPDGEFLIVRQVLQHLSNTDVKKILAKTKKFKYVLITESIYDAPDAVPNIDKQADNQTRVHLKSGVYLEHAPYNFENIVHLLKVYAGDLKGVPSTLRSTLIIN